MRSIEQGYSGDATTRQGYGLTEKDSSGLNHTWFRKQEQRAGRWTSPDPYKGSMNLGNPQSFNRCSYVENEPTNFVDPSGLQLRRICETWATFYIKEDGTRGDMIPGTEHERNCYWIQDSFGLGSSRNPFSQINFGGGGGGSNSNPPVPPKPPCDPDKPSDTNTLDINGAVGFGQAGFQINGSHLSIYAGPSIGPRPASFAVTASGATPSTGVNYNISLASLAAYSYSGSLNTDVLGSLRNGTHGGGAGTPNFSVGLFGAYRFGYRNPC